MKIRVSLFPLLCAFAAAGALRAADDTPAAPAAPAAPATPAAPAARKHEDQTELGGHMEKIGGAYRRLGRQIKDPAKNEDSLKQVETIRTHAEAALKLKPEKLADIPEDQRAKFMADYEEQMKSFIADADKLEAALKAGKNDEAAAVIKTMKKDQDDAHREFRKKKDKM